MLARPCVKVANRTRVPALDQTKQLYYLYFLFLNKYYIYNNIHKSFIWVHALIQAVDVERPAPGLALVARPNSWHYPGRSASQRLPGVGAHVAATKRRPHRSGSADPC